MNILIISRYPPFPGGRENFVLELANQLAVNNSVCVVTPDVDTNKDINPSIIKYPESVQELNNIIDNFKPDIINSHTFYLSDNTLNIAKETDIPFGLTLHGDQFAIGDKQRQDIVSRVSRESDFVINVSENGKQSLIKNVSEIDKDKIFVINNGVNLEKFNNQKIESNNLRNELSIDSNNFVVLTPTRIAPYKGIDFLLNTINLGKDFFEKSNFLFLISIPDYEFSEDEKIQFDDINKKMQSLNLNGLIKLTFKKYEDMYKLYGIADVFLLPSEKEQFPMSILEAMASGIPVIATNVGGIPELLSDGKDSLLVNFGDSESLFKSVKSLYEKQDLIIKDAARYKVENTYSIVDVTKKYIEIFEKYIKNETNRN